LTMDPFDPEAQKLIAEEIRCVVFTCIIGGSELSLEFVMLELKVLF